MAITATVTSTKIDITSTGGVQETFDDVVIAVNAVLAGTILGSGTSGDPYEIKGDRELEFSSGVKVLFQQNTFVEWNEITSSGRYAIYLAAGSEIEIEDGCSFDVSGSPQANIYNSFYGKITANGTSGNRIVLKGGARNYNYPRDEQVWNYVDIVDNTVYGFYLNPSTIEPDCSATNIRIYNTSGNSGIGMFLTSGKYANWTFDEIEIYDKATAIYALDAAAKITNSYFHDCDNQALFYNVGGIVGDTYQTAQDDTIFKQGYLQTFMRFENCTWEDMDLGSYLIYAGHGSKVVFKDCTFTADTYSGSQNGIYSFSGSRVIFLGTNTFSNLNADKVWATDGTFLHGREIEVYVEDVDGSPIENAFVGALNASDKEKWQGYTRSDGYLKNMFGDPMILIEKEETSNGVFEQWSNDESSDLCHQILVDKFGYNKYQICLEMTEEKSLEVVLTPYTETPTTIKNASITGTNIFY